MHRPAPTSTGCTPGSLDQAHKPNEFLAASQLSACVAFMKGLADELSR